MGVAHGSSIDDHIVCMLARAMAHAHVLPQPGPRVASADFGDNTLMHGVCLWLDIGASANGSGVRASCAG